LQETSAVINLASNYVLSLGNGAFTDNEMYYMENKGNNKYKVSKLECSEWRNEERISENYNETQDRDMTLLILSEAKSRDKVFTTRRSEC
jgi:hypothetical protein